MTGVFFIRKKGEKKPEAYDAMPYYEAIDFYKNKALHGMIYDLVRLMKTGEIIEIVCDTEE